MKNEENGNATYWLIDPDIKILLFGDQFLKVKCLRIQKYTYYNLKPEVLSNSGVVGTGGQ